ncbi:MULTISPECIES: signal peptidase I [unclassified Hyphomonas]|jgi:signal peptidase I|uniref:signal peptidase I n=1 Tax=hydrothermal vent metagenome TaxID=652676 RepID=A0A160U081_9ZZZZ|nr:MULTISPECIES: signal peptidase I [unclassified Hyphomonas]MAN90217.1 signal peptidase I [Hyphomonadaceae bacterium]MAA81955.1 signal peptidase I [Hyphomonas sp.]MAL43428.1 signal peptidase I [Hyphomonas sp.]MAX82725.1 signal peptidase I [Hyphomonas sp.]MBG66862.1 signal peptidase I [Hyphomonas sp.]|tara:strand:+ start:14128 stop:14982 length:855 start_codon:yes stop_codon:yes gene_type:complete
MASDGNTAANDEVAEAPGLGAKLKQELREWGATLAVFVPVFLLFSGLAYEQRVIPSESMVPTLQVTDRVAVAKFAYGYDRYSLPFSMGRFIPLPEGRIFASTPKRGDVVVFEHPHTGRVMIKRLIGLPGDQIQLIGEQLYLNGEAVESEYLRTIRYVPHNAVAIDIAHEWQETIGDKTWITHRQEKGGRGDNTDLFIVPEGHVFMMGDNRDNSLDSRFPSGHCPAIEGVIDRAGCQPRVPADVASIGFVPMDHMIGRAETVLVTFHKCKLQDEEPCRKRVWKGL